MNMNLSDLLKQERVRKVEPDELQAAECIKLAERDIRIAKEMLGKDADWAFGVAYNSMLQAARAVMFHDGFIAAGENQHKTVVDYSDAKFGTKLATLVRIFDDMRRKRNKLVYEKVGVVSDFEAKFAIKTAEEFLATLKEKIKR